MIHSKIITLTICFYLSPCTILVNSVTAPHLPLLGRRSYNIPLLSRSSKDLFLHPVTVHVSKTMLVQIVFDQHLFVKLLPQSNESSSDSHPYNDYSWTCVHWTMTGNWESVQCRQVFNIPRFTIFPPLDGIGFYVIMLHIKNK